MIASRLARRRKPAAGSPATVDVKSITGATVYDDLTATHQQVQVKEDSGPLGEVATVIHDVFYFDRLVSTSALPAILEKHIIHWDSVEYEVISAQQLDELAQKLRVETRRVR